MLSMCGENLCKSQCAGACQAAGCTRLLAAHATCRSAPADKLRGTHSGKVRSMLPAVPRKFLMVKDVRQPRFRRAMHRPFVTAIRRRFWGTACSGERGGTCQRCWGRLEHGSSIRSVRHTIAQGHRTNLTSSTSPGPKAGMLRSLSASATLSSSST